jgi:hypothetical protein
MAQASEFALEEPGLPRVAPLDPQLFADACAKLGGPATRVLELGERIDVQPAGATTDARPGSRSNR